MFAIMGAKLRFLKLVLSGEVSEGPVHFPFLARRTHVSLPGLLQLLESARQDRQISAVLVVVKNLSIGWAQIEELHRLFARLREDGKRLFFFLQQANNRTFYLAAVADRLYLPPSASLDFVGLRSETFFFKNLLSYLGVESQLFNIGAYKSAAEIFQRESMSESSRAMADSILDDLQRRLVELIATHRRVSPEQVRSWIDNGPYTPRRALSAGLIDGICYEDELTAALENQFPGIREVPRLKSKLHDTFFKRCITFYRPQIALIVGEGLIMSGRSRRARGHRPILGAETLISSLKDACRRRRVRAIVLRLNTPGGSTLASDLIWREIRLTNQKKPVIVTFGNVAASGGYYIATAAQKIFANPSTLTGSIGVIGGKFSIARLLSKIGITTDAVEKGPQSGYASATRPFSPEEADKVQTQMREFYEDLFLPKVAVSRRRDIAEIRPLAEGRVWTGSQAQASGLIDVLGGLDEAVHMAKELTGLLQKKSRLLAYAQRRSLLDSFPLQWGPPLLSERILALMPEEYAID